MKDEVHSILSSFYTCPLKKHSPLLLKQWHRKFKAFQPNVIIILFYSFLGIKFIQIRKNKKYPLKSVKFSLNVRHRLVLAIDPNPSMQ